jgi:lysophospholipase L1-like esterase
MQLQRWTGLQFLSIACSGNCKMQPYFGEVLCDAKVDALVFDSFSNPKADMIQERLFPFIEQLQKAHPDIPLIFQQTISRERSNFDLATRKVEMDKKNMAEKLMKEACKKYKNVYFIQTNAADELEETSVDGTHPNDYGYTLWAKSIEKPLLKILKKYGIK